MKLAKIVDSITEGIAHNRTLFSIFSEAYGTRDAKELLKLQAQTISALERISAKEGWSKRVRTVLEDIETIVSYPCLSETAQQAGLVWSEAHAATMEVVIERYSEDDLRVAAEIAQHIEALQKEAQSEAEAAFVEELEEAYEAFETRYAIEGNLAYKSLLAQMLGLVALYRQSLQKATPDFKRRLKELIELIIRADKLVDALSGLKDAAMDGWRLLGM